MYRIKNKEKSNSWAWYGFASLAFIALGTSPALANADLSDVSRNILNSSSLLPNLVSGISYLAGLVFGIIGVIKTRGHVENAQQVPIQQPLGYFGVGGLLLSLPTIIEIVRNTIDPNNTQLDPNNTFFQSFLSAIGNINVPGLGNTTAILNNIIQSVQDIPTLVSGGAYLLGLVVVLSGVFTIRDHIEDPRSVPMRHIVRKFLLAGALFALPMILTVFLVTITGGNQGNGAAAAYMTLVSTGANSESGLGCIGGGGGLTGIIIGIFGQAGLGTAICNLFRATQGFPPFFTAIAYLFGIFVAVWGLIKINEHIKNPDQVSIWDGVSKVLVAGGFLALPYIITVIFNTVMAITVPHTNTGLGANLATVLNGGAGGQGLDGMLVALMGDVFGPMASLLNIFGLAAGCLLIFIGISRLLKSAQDGAKGPAGIGTLMTFITGGLLLSFSPFVALLSTSIFGDPLTETQSFLRYTAGMTGPEIARTEAVFNAAIQFVLIVGLISVMRGMFIMRSLAEGGGQASMMAGITHLVGGAIAVNLGPMINLVSGTLGLTGLGVGVQFN